MQRSRTLLAALAVALTLSFPAAAQAPADALLVTTADKIAQPLPDAAIADNFASGLALDANRLVVGAMHDDEIGTNAGAAYVYRWVAGHWRFQAKLFGVDTDEHDRFGSGAASDGNTIAIAADRDNDPGAQGGSVYVFRRESGLWVHEAKLVPADWDPFDRFGYDLDLEGERIAIGAYEPGWPGTFYVDHGSVYVFDRTGTAWSQTAHLRAADGQDYDHMGSSVALQGDLVVTGAPGDDDGGLNAGAAYVFAFDGTAWSEVAKLVAADAAPQAAFGLDVALSGTTLAVGAPGESSLASSAGAVYVFEGAGASWTQVAKLAPSDGAAFDRFGTTVAVDGERLAAGAAEADAGGPDRGATWVYRRFGGAWHPLAKLAPAVAFDGDELGRALALEGQRVVTGSLFADPEFWLPDSGAAYSVELDAHVQHPCQPAAHSGGHAARLSAAGTLSVAADDLVLAVHAGPANQAGVFLYGPDHAQVPFGNGALCVGPGGVGVLRIPPPVKLDAAGHASFPLDLAAPPLGSGPGQVQPGSTWSFQYWFRDKDAGPGASNLTESVRLTFHP